jgi:AcrR family transcriptional regulator
MAKDASSGLTRGDRSSHRPSLGRPARSGLHPPQQARSRAALQRLLASAEEVLINEGLEDFTIARVAEHAGVSVGGVYRRFASKEHLIEAIKQDLAERLEEAVAQALDTAEPSLGGVIEAFTAALSGTLNESGRVIPAVLAGGRSVDAPEQGLRIITALQQRFLDAATLHGEQIRHPDAATALNIAFRSVIAAGTHRAAASPWWPDGLTWPQWAREIADMTLAYLTTDHRNTSSAT